MNQNNTDELYHYGVLNMRWGVRRYQNKDGSLTPAGKRRAAKLKDKYLQVTGKKLVGKAVSTKDKSTKQNKEDIHKKKNVDTMSDAELKEKTNRLNLENNYINAINSYNNLNPKQVSRGQKLVKKIMDDIVVPSATEVGKKAVKNYLEKAMNDAINNKKK